MRRGDVVVPFRELGDELEAVREVLRVFEEAPAILHQAVRLGAGTADLLQRVRFGDALRLRVEVGGARELRQLGPQIAHVARGLLHLWRLERLELEFADTNLLRAGGVDRVLDGDDAAGGERLALVVVRELHRVLDRVGDLRFAAEHVDDGVLEELAHLVVRRLVVSRAEPFENAADGVGRRGRYCTPGERAFRYVDACVQPGDRILVALAGRHDFREVRESPKCVVVSVDVERHGLGFLLFTAR